MSIRLHRPLVEAVTDALHTIFKDGRYADKVIEKLLRSNPKWGARDRAFIAEYTYECVRWMRLLDVASGSSPKDLQYYYQIVGTLCVIKGIELPWWPEYRNVDKEGILARYKEALTIPKIAQSIPDWMHEYGRKELGEQWDKELIALNQPAEIVLRVNTLKTNKNWLQTALKSQDWPTHDIALTPDALVLDKRGNIFGSSLFTDGMFEIQDAGSQCIAPFLNIEPGMRIIDACAGAGGKTLHLACLSQNKGQIIAMDTEAHKLEELKKRARRNGAHNIETRVIENSKTIKRLAESADRLLLDVPCSGLGVLRRNPDAKWKLSPDFMASVKVTQAEILENYAKMLRKGGQMVYATCSIMPSENAEQVKQFLQKNPNFNFVNEKTVSPSVDGFDGFYMALLERKG